MVAKLLSVEKMGNPDIDPVILFLFTIVTKNTKEDKEKLRRILKYLKHTMDDKGLWEQTE